MSDITLDGTSIHKLPQAYPKDVNGSNSFFVLSINEGNGFIRTKKVLSSDMFTILGQNAHELIDAFDTSLLQASNSYFHAQADYRDELVAGETFGNFLAVREYALTSVSCYLQTYAVGNPVTISLYNLTDGEVVLGSDGNELEPITLLSQEQRIFKNFSHPPLLDANKQYGFRIDSVGKSVKGSNLSVQMVLTHPNNSNLPQSSQSGGGGGSSNDLDVITIENIDLVGTTTMDVFVPVGTDEYVPLVAYAEYKTLDTVTVEPELHIEDESGAKVFSTTPLDSTVDIGDLTPLAMDSAPPKISEPKKLVLNVTTNAAANTYVVDLHIKLFKLS
jgi:hypothetical protein